MIYEEIAKFAKDLPKLGGLIGLDLGTKTIGIAVSDHTRNVATPLETIKRQKFNKDAETLLKLCNNRALKGIILGLPRNMNGTEGPRAQSTRAFARNFSQKTNLMITYWDERLSIVAAEKLLLEVNTSRKRRSELIDHVAASYILQGALDRLRQF